MNCRSAHRIHPVVLITLCILCTRIPALSEETPVYKNPAMPVEERVTDLLGQMTLEEKISLLAGKDGGETKTIDRLGIPPLRVIDGPHGVGWGNKSTCFPSGISMGACWNPALIEEVGQALASETRAAGRNILLGPCVNIHRIPNGGRNFESYSEDPYLAGRIAVAYIKGIQSQRIGTSLKHFACNNQEWERLTISTEIDERTLQEIYLPAFKAAVTEAHPWTVMSAYNKVNGSYCSENKHLQLDLLKKAWGFNGFIVSDWGATHSVVGCALNGLDLEMPGPGEFFGPKLLEAVRAGEVNEEIINDKVRRLLRVMFWAGLFDPADKSLKAEMATPAHAALARRLSEEAIVLLKNQNDVLPLNKNKIKSIAVFGPNANEGRPGGGGSSNVEAPYLISPLQGIKDKLPDGVTVTYDEGCPSATLTPIASENLSPPDAQPDQHGLKAEYFDNMNLEGEPVVTRIDANVDMEWGDGSPDPKLPIDGFSARWTGVFTPPRSGSYQLGMGSDDGFRIFLDGKMLIDGWRDRFGQIDTTTIELEAGRPYNLRIEYYENMGGAAARFGWVPPTSTTEGITQLAHNADAAIICVGLFALFEGEGYDRSNIDMPGQQNDLIKTVVAANPNTIVVLINGTPLDMTSWIDQAPAVVEAWYPGLEGGHAIANVLFGDVNPSGKLPDTFAKKLEDYPSFATFPGSDGKVFYSDGIYVGYRHFDTREVEPLFPFGHGLSYTKFDYANLTITPVPDSTQVRVSFELENTGNRAGAEVAQLYVRDVVSSIERPMKELKAFKKVHLKPGEKRTTDLYLDQGSFSFFDPEKNLWVAEPGEFEILVGSSSRDIRLNGMYTLK